jgi:formamidase
MSRVQSSVLGISISRKVRIQKLFRFSWSSRSRVLMAESMLTHSVGDGEISFCGAIEMAGVITIKFSVMKGGVKQLDMKSPIYIPGPVEPQFGPGRYIYFEGFSVDEHGKQHYLDTTVAYRQTSLRVIEYLRRYGK